MCSGAFCVDPSIDVCTFVKENNFMLFIQIGQGYITLP